MNARLTELRSVDLFDGMTDQQLSELLAGSTEVHVRPGLELFREGEHADFWWVLLDGAIDLVRRIGAEETVVARMDRPGRWAGGFRAWDEQGSYLATGRGATDGRVLRIPAEVLRERIEAWFPLAGHLIEGLYRTARSIEATARQRQSVLALGTLAAGRRPCGRRPGGIEPDAAGIPWPARRSPGLGRAAHRAGQAAPGGHPAVGGAGRAGAGRPRGCPGIVAHPPRCRPRMDDRAGAGRRRG